MERPEGIVDFTPDPKLFPFTSRWFDSSVGPIHYIDEGDGPAVLLMHGNPDWSFLYRDIITALGPEVRCIAPDYPGFGLSVHPDGYGYMPAEHADVVLELVEHLDLNDVVVMGQDWGGPIGLDIASRVPDRIKGLVMANTWFWPADDRTMKAFSKLMGSRPIQALITKRNFFVTVVMKRSLQTKMSPDEFAHYTDVLPTPESRRGAAVFPIAITAARPWLTDLETRVAQTLRDKPAALVFGKKDFALGSDATVARWRKEFPKASVVEIPDAGHFIQEDNPAACVAAIREILSSSTPTDNTEE